MGIGETVAGGKTTRLFTVQFTDPSNSGKQNTLECNIVHDPNVDGAQPKYKPTDLCKKMDSPLLEATFLPSFEPLGLFALLWTVLWMFAEMSPKLLSGEFSIGSVALVCIPLLFYFFLMFGVAWAVAKLVLKLRRDQVVTFAFTAASNNFELALAATSAIFGTSSPQAVATIVGPMIEIPVMLLMVKVSKCLR